jgi:hypothetical protein
MCNPKITATGLAFLLAALATTGPGSAQTLPWKEACLAIEPTIACKAENRSVIEEALASCRTAADKPACHKRYIVRLRERPTGPPTVIRGSRVN